MLEQGASPILYAQNQVFLMRFLTFGLKRSPKMTRLCSPDLTQPKKRCFV